jgi:hypothetical protein
MAPEFVSEIADRLGVEGVSNMDGAHVKTISAEYYKRTENGVVTNELIQEAIDNISPKVKYKKTVVQHTITADDVTHEKCPFADPILMPTDYGNKTVAMINLYGSIMTSDTSAVTSSYIVWLDNDTSHSMGSQTLSTNFITTDNYQVNFVANIQLPFTTGTMHPSGLYLDIWRHGLPADSTVSVTAEVTILDRE